jgi:hypothetical protein
MAIIRIGRKGQEEAPFALFLAAIMIALLLPIVFRMYSDYQNWQCKTTVQNNMEDLARKMEIAMGFAGNNTIVNVDLSAFGCVNFQVVNFTLEAPTSQRCIKYCGYGRCMWLRANAYNPDGTQASFLSPTCLKVPLEYTVDTSGSVCTPPDRIPLVAGGLDATHHTLVFVKKQSFGVNKLYICEVGT